MHCSLTCPLKPSKFLNVYLPVLALLCLLISYTLADGRHTQPDVIGCPNMNDTRRNEPRRNGLLRSQFPDIGCLPHESDCGGPELARLGLQRADLPRQLGKLRVPMGQFPRRSYFEPRAVSPQRQPMHLSAWASRNWQRHRVAWGHEGLHEYHREWTYVWRMGKYGFWNCLCGAYLSIWPSLSTGRAETWRLLICRLILRYYARPFFSYNDHPLACARSVT